MLTMQLKKVMILQHAKCNDDDSAGSSELFEAASSSPNSAISEKLARYGSNALSGVEHLTLLVGKESIALALIRHFGSLKALSRASFLELRQFLPQEKAQAVIAALSMCAIAETEHALSEQLVNPESVYHACANMKLLNQEVLRVILMDTRLSQLGQVRWGSVLMDLTALQSQSELKTTPRSTPMVGNRPAQPRQTVLPFHKQLRVPLR